MNFTLSPLNASEMLQVWETGRGKPPVMQALFLLAAVHPDESLQTLAELPIGQRDRLLLDLRRWLFGPLLESLVICPQCGERLELGFDMASIQVPETHEIADKWELELDGYNLSFRLPNSQDILNAQLTNELEAGRLSLLESCVLEARRGDQPTSAAELPAEVRSALTHRLAALDPQADVNFPITCPACDHDWLALFDIATFLWQELSAWALHTLNEVHTLASSYAWREVDILALSPWRRQIYIEMATR